MEIEDDFSDEEDHDRLSEIIKGELYLSDFSSAENDKLLKEFGIRVILNMCFGDYDKEHSRQYEVHKFPIYDQGLALISKFFDDTSRIIKKAQKEKKPVLVHCIAGYSRSPTIVIAYLMKEKQWDYQKCFEYISEIRMIGPNKGFVMQLKEYQREVVKKKIDI